MQVVSGVAEYKDLLVSISKLAGVCTLVSLAHLQDLVLLKMFYERQKVL